MLALAAAVPARAQVAGPMNPGRPEFSNGASTVGAGLLQVEAGGPRQGFADAGIAYALDEDRVLDLDVIVGLSSSAPDWGLTGGISVRF